MSFYRSIIAVVVTLGLASAVYAADENNVSAQNPAADAQALQTADASSTTQQTAAPAAEQTKVDVNKATVKELSKVKGLNTTKAKAIVAYRKKHGEFKSLDELTNVKGFKKMKDETLKNIQDQLTTG